MKKGIFFQIIIIFIILVGWNLLHIGYKFQKDVFEDNLSESPMMLLSMHTDILKQLKTSIEKRDYINSITVLQDSIIAQTLIDSYELDSNEDILKSYVLPTAMQINFVGKSFQFEQKNELENMLLEYSPKVIYYFNDREWQIVQDKISLLIKIYYICFGSFIVFTLFFSTFFRYHFEMKSNTFWKIYYSSGGHYRKRSKQFLVNSLYICFIPLILNLILYYAIKYFQILSVEIDYRYFGIELLTVIFSSFIAGLISGKNLK